jgi:hypothetical protein
MHLEQELKNGGDGGVLVAHANVDHARTNTAADNRALFSMSKSYSVEVSEINSSHLSFFDGRSKSREP